VTVDEGRKTPERGVTRQLRSPSEPCAFLELSQIPTTTRQPQMHSRCFRIANIFFVILSIQVLLLRPAIPKQTFRSDEWITECELGPGSGTPDCSITVPFWQAQGVSDGSFALVVMLQTGNIGIVGQPFPVKAVLRVDKNPPIECRQMRYCVFPSAQALAVTNQMKVGSLILIDVFTVKGTFSFSLTPKGYQAGMAKIRAWGYRLSPNYP
jgi:hypothetical protein